MIAGSFALQLRDTVTAPAETEFEPVPGKERFVDPIDPVRTKHSDVVSDKVSKHKFTKYQDSLDHYNNEIIYHPE